MTITHNNGKHQLVSHGVIVAECEFNDVATVREWLRLVEISQPRAPKFKRESRRSRDKRERMEATNAR